MNDTIDTDEATLYLMDAIPERHRAPRVAPRGWARDAVERFMLSGRSVAEVVPKAAPDQTYASLRKFCARYPRYRCGFVTRGGRGFLVRKKSAGGAK